MITKDGRDTPIEKLTADNYIVPKGEEKDYHTVIEVVQYDPRTGKRVSRPRVQKFGKKNFESHLKNSLVKQGYTITILHDPNVWLSVTAKAQKEARAKAEDEKFKAAVAAAVEKALAEREKAETKKPGRPAKAEQQAKEQAETKAESEK